MRLVSLSQKHFRRRIEFARHVHLIDQHAKQRRAEELKDNLFAIEKKKTDTESGLKRLPTSLLNDLFVDKT